MIKQVLRPASQVVQLDVFGVDSKVAVQSGKNFAKVNRTLDGFSAESIGGSNNLPGFHSAARQQTNSGGCQTLITRQSGRSASRFSQVVD